MIPDEAVEAAALESRSCLLCGVMFTPKVVEQRFCSESHRTKYRHAKNSKKNKAPGFDRCPATGKIAFATVEDALEYKVAANNPVLNVYRCHCGSWHWGRHLTKEQRERFARG